MKFSSFVPFFLLGGALAATPVEREVSLTQRDLATVSSVIADVQTKTNSLNTAFGNLNDASGVAAVRSAQSALLSSISSGTSRVQGTSALTLSEAFTVSNQVDGLISRINAAVDTAISKKSVVVAQNAAAEVKTGLNNLKSGGASLGAAIKSKVPSGAQSIADQKNAQIAAAIQRGIDAYADTRRARSMRA